MISELVFRCSVIVSFLCLCVLFLGGTRTCASEVQKEATLGVYFNQINKIIYDTCFLISTVM